MTDKEIIKALECCADLFDCISCPCKDFCGDLGKLQQNALDLINRQQAEIERLTADNEQYEKINLLIANQRNYRDKEIECLENAVEMLNCELDMAKDCIPEQRAEAIKEFAERLKKEKHSVCAGHGMSECVVSEFNIDNLVKEMVGEK